MLVAVKLSFLTVAILSQSLTVTNCRDKFLFSVYCQKSDFNNLPPPFLFPYSFQFPFSQFLGLIACTRFSSLIYVNCSNFYILSLASFIYIAPVFYKIIFCGTICFFIPRVPLIIYITRRILILLIYFTCKSFLWKVCILGKISFGDMTRWDKHMCISQQQILYSFYLIYVNPVN